MQLLKGIEGAEDLQRLTELELIQLCDELRRFLIQGVAETGGHLASNLGVVELTVALHRVFSFERDRLVFDVGHQSYVHKILTGRRDAFPGLRTWGGISGFPKPGESPADAFIAGHASNAISVALGMARARTRAGETHHVVSLVGDGAMTGGLAFEGLSNAGASGEPMIVVLNDNGMSITENVGGLARYLTRLRLRPGYNRFKRGYRAATKRLPFGRRLYRVTHRLKSWIKGLLLPCSFFEDLGLHYMGPVNGHDIQKLTQALEWAKTLKEPVLLHVATTKGKGYPFSEMDPDEYHGVGRFSPTVGVSRGKAPDFSEVFGDALVEIAREEPQVAAISAAMRAGTGLSKFAAAHPDRFYDVGIAEGHAVSMAAGMAQQGLIPVFAVYSTFLQRAYDMLIHDVALSDLHVVLAVDRAGLVGADGETHQGVFDAGFLCQIPNMTVYCPASFLELREMLRHCVLRHRGPVAIRYPRGGEGGYTGSAGTAPSAVLRRGGQITLVTYGAMTQHVLAAAETLAKREIQAQVVKLGTIKPLILDDIAASVSETGRLVVVEDQVRCGSVGQRILSGLTEGGTPPRRAALLNVGDAFIPHGDVAELQRQYGLDPAGIARRAAELMEGDRV